jgi:hypothetical protein
MIYGIHLKNDVSNIQLTRHIEGRFMPVSFGPIWNFLFSPHVSSTIVFGKCFPKFIFFYNIFSKIDLKVVFIFNFFHSYSSIFRISFSKRLTFSENFVRKFKFFGTHNPKLLWKTFSEFLLYVWSKPQNCYYNLIFHQFQSFFTLFFTLISI